MLLLVIWRISETGDRIIVKTQLVLAGSKWMPVENCTELILTYKKGVDSRWGRGRKDKTLVGYVLCKSSLSTGSN